VAKKDPDDHPEMVKVLKSAPNLGSFGIVAPSSNPVGTVGELA